MVTGQKLSDPNQSLSFLIPCGSVFLTSKYQFVLVFPNDFLFTTQDADGSVPFFWGTDSEGHLVLSDDVEIVKKGCGKSFAPFPKGTIQTECILCDARQVHHYHVMLIIIVLFLPSVTCNFYIYFNIFRPGCFFTTSKGLQSFEHPLNEVKPIPRVDSQGQVCGATYKVDAQAKKDGAGMPRVGSAADWSSHY